MKKVVLDIKKLTRSFESKGIKNTVISDLDLQIFKDDFTVIMGSSGSGKSTLLYSISGMDKPTSGEVLYKGEDIVKYKEKKMSKLRVKDFGFVFQQVHLVSNLSLLENILVPGYMNNDIKPDKVKERAFELLGMMNIKDAAGRFPSQVSGGEAQRGAVARAVINNPEILFADEPTGALNRKNTKDVLELFYKLNKEGQTIVMVTHDIKAALYGNRILYLDDGQIAGELDLPQFDEDDKKIRESKLNEWLNSMLW